MITDFPTAPLTPGLRGTGGGTVEKSLSASHTEILTLPIALFLRGTGFCYFRKQFFCQRFAVLL